MSFDVAQLNSMDLNASKHGDAPQRGSIRNVSIDRTAPHHASLSFAYPWQILNSRERYIVRYFKEVFVVEIEKSFFHKYESFDDQEFVWDL